MMNDIELRKWIDAGCPQIKKSKRRGIGMRKKTASLIMVFIIGALVLTASAGLISVFMTVQTTVTVNTSAIQIDGHNTPYIITETFSNKSAGESWNTSHTVVNLIDATFMVNWSITTDEGLNVKVQKAGYVDATEMEVEPYDTDYLYINYTLDPLIEPGDYSATIEILPVSVS